MRRAVVIGAALLLPGGTADAQHHTGFYWEQLGLRTNGGVRLLSGGTFADGASASAAGSAALQIGKMMLGFYGGTLRDAGGAFAGGGTLSAVFRSSDVRLEIRAGAATASYDNSGVSVTALGAALNRAGLSLSVRSSMLPATPARTYIQEVTERDTVFEYSVIEPAQPRRTYTDLEVEYSRSFTRVTINGAAGHRFSTGLQRPFWARAGALYQLSSAFAVGATFERDPGTPWLKTAARNATTFYIRVDPPRSRPASIRMPMTTVGPLQITLGSSTAFALHAPAAGSVEIAGTFSDWEPIALERDTQGNWRTALPLRSGVYQIVMRIDGGQWHAPPGVASVRDEFGGETGVFEVR